MRKVKPWRFVCLLRSSRAAQASAAPCKGHGPRPPGAASPLFFHRSAAPCKGHGAPSAGLLGRRASRSGRPSACKGHGPRPPGAASPLFFHRSAAPCKGHGPRPPGAASPLFFHRSAAPCKGHGAPFAGLRLGSAVRLRPRIEYVRRGIPELCKVVGKHAREAARRLVVGILVVPCAARVKHLRRHSRAGGCHI